MPDGLVDLIHELVAIDLLNPSLVSGGAGEREAAAFVALFGAGEGAHAAEDWVRISSTEAVGRTLLATAARVCA